jgi:hypothetical protein
MLFSSSALEARVSEVTDRLQRLEREHAQLLARIEGEAALRRVVAGAIEAAQTGAMIGAALEGFATAMRRPLKRGRAGGLARACQVSRLRERWPDGRYMTHSDWEQIQREVASAEYLRYAAGGFARAEVAARDERGRFTSGDFR